ncbi:hypothetical protein Taro_034099 [Colocasia esculenta]|uniref:Uncharacterized protein n=1 Tax=Colocasia esculenta TaxID=4460 RepID=A0A843WEH2_COLES|nr:hypothetical protein [Colocasia esculenta]
MTSSRTEFLTVRLLSNGRASAGRRRRGGSRSPRETSQQRQGARRAEKMGRVPGSVGGDLENRVTNQAKVFFASWPVEGVEVNPQS